MALLTWSLLVGLVAWFASHQRYELALLSIFEKVDAVQMAWLCRNGCTTQETANIIRTNMANFEAMSPARDFKFAMAQFKTRDGVFRDISVSWPAGVDEGADVDVILNIHGGGWFAGTPEMGSFNIFTNRANVIVFSVDYRQPPEHAFPTAANDCYDAFLWVHEYAKRYGGNPNRIIVAGLSAGGNLAASVALMAAESKGPKITKLILEAPGLSFLLDDQSFIDHALGFIWNTPKTLFARKLYLPNPVDWNDYRASPVLAPRELMAKLPPTLIIACTMDPLRDSAIEFHKKLVVAGAKSELFELNIPHAVHRFPPPLFNAEREAFESKVLAFLKAK